MSAINALSRSSRTICFRCKSQGAIPKTQLRLLTTESLEQNSPLEWLDRHVYRSKRSKTVAIELHDDLTNFKVSRIPVHPTLPSAAKRCREPLKTVSEAEFQRLDPTGARRKLCEKNDPDAIHVSDVVMVRTQSGDPFAGVVLRIQRKQHDSSVLLRNTISGTGIEREFKIFSPNVTGIEVVKRRTKAPKQNRLFYLR
jgi:ribosomal protein L19